MASRGGTSTAKGKPGTSQTRASKQRSRGTTRGRTADDDDDDEDDDDVTAVSGTAGSRRATTTAGKSKSLFDPDKGAKTDDGGEEGVKANDIWSKFVSDDQDVVRAPTADTDVSGVTRSSQRTRLTGETGSQGSQRPSQIDEEEEEEEEEESSDDDRTIYSDYYLPPEYMREEGTPGPRAEIVDSHEACSCFPNRSNKFIGAMLYDKVTCIHTGLVGHTQPGVFKFNPYWNENMEEPRKMRKRDMRIAKSKFVFGYPKPKFELISDSEEDSDDDETDVDDESESEPPPKTATKSLLKGTTPRTRAGEDDDDDDDDDSYDSDYDYSDDDDDEDDEDYIPYQLPQIGYPKTPSLPPSSQSYRSRYSDYTESVPGSLPPLPGTRQLTAQTKRTGVTQRTQRTHFTLPPSRKDTKTAKSGKTAKTVPKSKQKAKSVDSGYGDDVSSRRTSISRQSLPDGPVIGTNRTFQGKFYDPVTKQVMLYDIGTRPGQRIPDGNLEPLNKPSTVQTERKQTPKKDGTGSKPGTKGSKRSTTSQQSHHSVPKAAVLGAVFISNLLSKNKAKKEAVEAGYDDEEENA